MKLSEKDKDEVKKRYSDRYSEFGYSPKSLGWDKGKQDIRFAILTSQYNFEGKHVLDIGCGFGDLNKTLQTKAKNYKYTGIDMVEPLVKKGIEIFGKEGAEFHVGDFLDPSFKGNFDYAIASGIFNFKLSHDDNYNFVESVIKKALEVCKDGLAFDFLSDKVDYRKEITFHNSPEKILGIAYKFSRNVVLRNDYMPFEFGLFINKNDSFEASDSVFNSYKQGLNK